MDTGSGDKSNADNDLYLPQTDSFWEIGKYNRVVKRCDDGNKLTTDLMNLISERAELEKTFSKMLKSWSKKWSDYVAKSPEFGSMAAAWKAIMGEADASAEMHQTVHDELQNEIIPGIKAWQKTKYVKSMMSVKATKDFDEEFKRAQKPWAKLYVKVDKYKRDYHTATKNLKLAESQENNPRVEGNVPQDHRAKVAEKAERFRKEKESVKVKYAEALQELNRANPKYMDDMNEVFLRCQAFEKDRLSHFREFLGTTERCLDLSHRLQSPIFQQFSQTIKNSDPDKDLAWWSDTYGAGMKMNWPVLEEYTEANRTLSRRAKGEIEKENQVVVTAIRSNNNNNGPTNTTPVDNRLSTNNAAFNEENDSTPASPYAGYQQPTSAPADASPGWATNSWANDYGANNTNNNNGYSSMPNYQTNPMQSYPPAANPFNDDEDVNNVDSSTSSYQQYQQSPVSPGSSSFDTNAGVSVRALYDYNAQESDELSFKQGDVFTKIEDEDDQGWCKGRVGDRVGLYPATYVENL